MTEMTYHTDLEFPKYFVRPVTDTAHVCVERVTPFPDRTST